MTTILSLANSVLPGVDAAMKYLNIVLFEVVQKVEVKSIIDVPMRWTTAMLFYLVANCFIYFMIAICTTVRQMHCFVDSRPTAVA